MNSATCLRRCHSTGALTIILLCVWTNWDREIFSAEPTRSPAVLAKRKASLKTILGLLPPDRTQNGRVSFYDETFQDWQTRTGELPPDFDQMPSIPFLPDPLLLDEGDFFDYIFGRAGEGPEPRLFYDYSFDKWRQQSGEKIVPQDYPGRNFDDLLTDANGNRIASADGWQKKKAGIRQNLRWALGEEPAGVTNPGPQSVRSNARSESTFGSVISRPEATRQMRVMPISPYNGFGEMLFGYLYCPADRIDKEGRPTRGKLPVVVYLHEYDYAKGFSSDHNIDTVFRSIVQRGYAVFSYDMLGFGNRIEESTRFYRRYPRWSKMGKMVLDVRAALDALTNLDCVQRERIFVAGYSPGATVGLYSAALDERIAGVVSIAGFTAMRSNTANRGTEGVQAYSHLHGLLPRLGFFVGQEPRIPYDFHEILACMAPRPLLVIAPALDKDASVQDVQRCADQARKVYSLYDAEEMLQICSPEDYNRLSDEMLATTYRWLEDRPGR